LSQLCWYQWIQFWDLQHMKVCIPD